MKTELQISFVDKSMLYLDVVRDLWSATGKIANMLLLDFNKNNLDLLGRLTFLEELQKKVQGTFIVNNIATEDGEG